MAILQKKRLGELLVEGGHITEKIRDEALQKSKAVGKRIGQVLVAEGHVSDDLIACLLGQQYGLPCIGENILEVDKKHVQLLPHELSLKLNSVVIFDVPAELTVAIADPLNVFSVDELRKYFQKKIKTIVTTESLIRRAQEKFYAAKGDELEKILRQIDLKAYELKSFEDSPDRILRLAEDAPIVQIVNALLIQAINDRASDIHIEGFGRSLKVRERIDGLLHDVAEIPRALLYPIVSRIKIMADMDISEKRLPQDGHLQMELRLEGGKYTIGRSMLGRTALRVAAAEDCVDIRVSTTPTIQGEKVVLRLLKKREELLNLDNLNMGRELLPQLKKILTKPFGMILLTGPTGSGKTTTAYACLQYVNKNEKNIISIEDPVEYQIMGVNQIQVSSKIGLDFSNSLRSILRQDPDIMLVGEIRDRETAEIAIHAALTGHLVISTLHTNDAVSTIARLHDMGIEPFLISSAVTGILSQRLVRKICSHCKREITPSEEMVTRLKLPPFAKFYRGEGCSRCRETGYLDRSGVYELLTVTDSMKELIVRKADSRMIRDRAAAEGFVSLMATGIRLALEGVTTLEEVLSATYEEGA